MTLPIAIIFGNTEACCLVIEHCTDEHGADSLQNEAVMSCCQLVEPIQFCLTPNFYHLKQLYLQKASFVPPPALPSFEIHF